LCVHAATGIGQVVGDESAKAGPLIQLSIQHQAGIGRDTLYLEFNLQRGVEGEVKRPALLLSHWVSTSETSSSQPQLYRHRRLQRSDDSVLQLKMEM
jgi:hypothetical protein